MANGDSVCRSLLPDRVTILASLAERHTESWLRLLTPSLHGAAGH